jgi:[protein-PII] uridylyltransferase
MQRYYQNAKLVTQLNSLVMQVLADRLLPARPGPPIVIDAHFQMVRELLDVRDEEVFRAIRAPSSNASCCRCSAPKSRA